MKKCFLSILLAFVMVLGAIPMDCFTAHAEELPETAETVIPEIPEDTLPEHREDVALLQAEAAAADSELILAASPTAVTSGTITVSNYEVGSSGDSVSVTIPTGQGFSLNTTGDPVTIHADSKGTWSTSTMPANRTIGADTIYWLKVAIKPDSGYALDATALRNGANWTLKGLPPGVSIMSIDIMQCGTVNPYLEVYFRLYKISKVCGVTAVADQVTMAGKAAYTPVFSTLYSVNQKGDSLRHNEHTGDFEVTAGSFYKKRSGVSFSDPLTHVPVDGETYYSYLRLDNPDGNLHIEEELVNITIPGYDVTYLNAYERDMGFTILVAYSATKHITDNCTPVTFLSATSNMATPVLGATAKGVTFTTKQSVPAGSPAYIVNTPLGSSSGWVKGDGRAMVRYDGSTFTPGTYAYRTQLRIQSEESFALAKDVVVVIDNNTWTVTGDIHHEHAGNQIISFVTIESPSYFVSEEAGTPLTIEDHDVFNIVTNDGKDQIYVGYSIPTLDLSPFVYGGTPPYTFCKSAGLPWIKVSPDGVISGVADRPSTGSELRVTVTDAADAMCTVAIYVGNIPMPKDKLISLSSVSFTFDDIPPVFGKLVAYSDITSGHEAVTIRDGAWEKQTASGWTTVTSGRISAGTWRYCFDAETTGEGGLTHVLADDCKIYVNGTEWTKIGTYEEGFGFSRVRVASPSYVINDITDTYTVTYHANGGSGTMNPVSGVHYGEYTLSACKFKAPEGKEFLGWATSATGPVITGNLFFVNKDIDLYARWLDKGVVYVGGIPMNEGDYLAQDASAATTVEPADHYAYLAKEGSGYVLTLHNFNYSGNGYKFGRYSTNTDCYALIYATGSITIRLEGANSLTTPTVGDNLYSAVAVPHWESCTVEGGKTDSLRIESKDYGFGCHVGTYGNSVSMGLLRINGCTVTATARDLVIAKAYQFSVDDCDVTLVSLESAVAEVSPLMSDDPKGTLFGKSTHSGTLTMYSKAGAPVWEDYKHGISEIGEDVRVTASEAWDGSNAVAFDPVCLALYSYLRFELPGATIDGTYVSNEISVKVKRFSGSATLIVAQYEGSKMVDVQTMTVSADGTYTMNELTHKTGCTYKAFLVNSTSYAPLCAADEF